MEVAPASSAYLASATTVPSVTSKRNRSWRYCHRLGNFTPERENVPEDRIGSSETVPAQERVSPLPNSAVKAYELSPPGLVWKFLSTRWIGTISSTYGLGFDSSRNSTIPCAISN